MGPLSSMYATLPKIVLLYRFDEIDSIPPTLSRSIVLTTILWRTSFSLGRLSKEGRHLCEAQMETTVAKLSPFHGYKISAASLPSEMVGYSPQIKYYVKVWWAPAQIGNICELVNAKKKPGSKNNAVRLTLRSIVDGQPTTGTYHPAKGWGGTVLGLKIKRGHSTRVVDWFKARF